MSQIVAILVACSALMAWQAYVVLIMWGWFIEPQFAIPAPTFWGVWGLILTISVVRSKAPTKQEDPDVAFALMSAFIAPTIAILIAYGVKLAGGF